MAQQRFFELSEAMAEAVSAIRPALVTVMGRPRMPATGIVYSADGLIVTAHHVLERDQDIKVVTADGTVHSATLVGRDPQNDLAVLKVDASLTPATWGKPEQIKVGNLVLAVGKPAEQAQASLGAVIALVSAPSQTEERERHKKRRHRAWSQVLVDGYIQTDVTMYPGFSGGALINGDGNVHGLNTSGFGRGTSISVPVTTIQNTVKTLQQHGKMRQGYLGVGLQPVRLADANASALEQEAGLLIISVEKDSPAHQGGLLVGDIVVGLDGEGVERMEELMLLLSGERVGKTVPVKLIRGGELKDVPVTIGEKA